MFRVEIGAGEINSKQDFMNLMSRSFGVSGYFGENRDALWDMMQDLFWIDQDHILLIIQNHQLLPLKLTWKTLILRKSSNTHFFNLNY